MKMVHVWRGKILDDLSKEELLQALAFHLDSQVSRQHGIDERMAEENKRLKAENERLWECLGSRRAS